MNDLIAIYGFTVAAGLTVESIKAISPFLAASISGQPSAHDQWMEFRGYQRVKELILKIQQLEVENHDLKQTISEAEKRSPGSGYTKALQEYITTPLDEKVELLRNALLNGLYGNYSVSQREDFYKVISNLYPLDVKILAYLIDLDQNRGQFDTEMYTHHSSLPGIKDNFSDVEEYTIERSIVRLRSEGLIDNTLATLGDRSPYVGCCPLSFASTFMKFIADPLKMEGLHTES